MPRKTRHVSTSFDLIAEMKSRTLVKPSDVVELVRFVEERESGIQNKKEHMWCVGLDTRNQVVFMDLVSLGTLNYNLVHPRETFRRAVMEDVASVILIHNHPSETPTFSDEDVALMKRMQQAGKIMGIEILDFVVYAGGEFKSAKKDGIM
jgi:DNA repair protein RadC